MDILRLLDQLDELAVENPRSILGVLFWGLDKDEIRMHIQKIRASLPQEVKVAANTARDSDRIIESAKEDAHLTLENAKKEAERIVQEARAEGDRIRSEARIEQARLVAESEILKLSKAQSDEVRAGAERDALQMRRGAEKYAFDVLNQLEGVVGKVMTTIERGKSEMTPESRDQAAPSPTRARDKVRAQG